LRRNHTREFKLECCCPQVLTASKRPPQICREHNLSESSVLLRWPKEEYEERAESRFHRKATLTQRGT
jgi:transposase-like protein